MLLCITHVWKSVFCDNNTVWQFLKFLFHRKYNHTQVLWLVSLLYLSYSLPVLSYVHEHGHRFSANRLPRVSGAVNTRHVSAAAGAAEWALLPADQTDVSTSSVTQVRHPGGWVKSFRTKSQNLNVSFVVTMHLGLCEQYVKSFGLTPSGFDFLFHTRPRALWQ